MIISKEYPPNIEEIRKNLELHPGIIFTYGDTIYNPDDGYIDDPLEIHERTHKLQQGIDSSGWWKKYLEDKKFRFEQEREAYRNQYHRFCDLNKDRNIRAKFLYRIASDLASEMYGNICTHAEAMKQIKQGIK